MNELPEWIQKAAHEIMDLPNPSWLEVCEIIEGCFDEWLAKQPEAPLDHPTGKA